MTNSASHDPNDHTSAEILRRSLNQCEVQLAQTQQELSGLLYAISHDLRAPLRAVTGFANALQDHLSTALDDTSIHYIRRLEQSSLHMTAMIDALATLSRASQGDMVPMDCDLGNLCQEVLADIRTRHPQHQHQHQPSITVASPLPIYGDPRLLKQAMTKLLENAWKCTIECSHPNIEVGSIEEAENTIYFVRDNGIGFDMSLANKLFVPFQQLHGDDRLRGQGLGLAIVQRIIARHGGRIWAQAEPHHGAQFFFSLPS